MRHYEIKLYVEGDCTGSCYHTGENPLEALENAFSIGLLMMSGNVRTTALVLNKLTGIVFKFDLSQGVF